MELLRFIKQDLKNIQAMWPKTKRWGLKYIFNKRYRKKCQNREDYEKQKKKRGSAFCSNRKSLKTWLLKNSGNKCFWCEKRMTFETATIDHIIPSASGGSNKKDNLRLIHDSCRVERDNLILKGILKLTNP